MCVLIVKNKGVNMPTTKILTACTEANPHGFGIATPNGVVKTLDAKEFIETAKRIPPDVPAIIHCRLATHGSVKKSNCHPFEAQDWIFAHNGVLDITPKGDMTDSETAFRQIFLPIIQASGINNPNVRRIINAVRGYGSKFAFMNKTTAKITTFGEFSNIDGVLFSNTRWTHCLHQDKSRHRLQYYSDEFFAKIFDTPLQKIL